MKKQINIIILAVISLVSTSAFAQRHFENDLLEGRWEGTSSIASEFGFAIDDAILEIHEVDERRFIGTLTAISPENLHEPVVTPISGIIIKDRGLRLHASAGTGGIIDVKLKYGRQGMELEGHSLSTVAPNEEFPFLPIASILELKKQN